MNWSHHFKNRPAVNLELFPNERITSVEHQRVGPSIAEFRRGESSEAREYLGKSRRFALNTANPLFFEEAKLFVQEENFHSQLLSAFMMQMGIEEASESWADDLFRWVRSWGDISWSSQVLLTAEVLAQVYYPALKETTSSKMLRAICNRIIDDEAFHIEFQAERIAAAHARHSYVYRLCHLLLSLMIFGGATLVMWLEHRAILGHTLSFPEYLAASWRRYQFASRRISIHIRNGTRVTSPVSSSNEAIAAVASESA